MIFSWRSRKRARGIARIICMFQRLRRRGKRVCAHGWHRDINVHHGARVMALMNERARMITRVSAPSARKSIGVIIKAQRGMAAGGIARKNMWQAKSVAQQRRHRASETSSVARNQWRQNGSENDGGMAENKHQSAGGMHLDAAAISVAAWPSSASAYQRQHRNSNGGIVKHISIKRRGSIGVISAAAKMKIMTAARRNGIGRKRRK